MIKQIAKVIVAWVCIVHTFSALAAEARFVVTDAAGKPVSDAVVALYDGKTAAVAGNATAKIVQKNRQFNPKLTVIQTGTSVQFPNEDSVRHHVYSFSPAKKFELKLYSGIPANPVQFDQAGLVTLGCNIHDSMLGYIYIVDTPYFAKTDSNGKATVKIDEGLYTYQVWQPGQAKPATEQKIKIEGEVAVKATLP